ncbi:helix-turn-helix transcriptional regulator [Leucobacter weissii]|uniref:Helix-turn-helix transcriptional regulator n=2 Tax=Leucobacter weissii TaxID=1983706 RepID=A0A939MP35_9MICO|nr:helix-turn-helix transcriptional regulator [Leucobacter weissii]
MTGEYALRRDELQSSARALAGHDYHALWLDHVLAAATALACGDPWRALLEWQRFLRRIPRFVPLRLRDYADGVLRALLTATGSEPEHPQAGDPGFVGRLVGYLSGDRQTWLGLREVNPHDGRLLPVIRLAATHLAAAEAQHPADLLKVAGRLRRLELWGPAAAALSGTREILLSRRTVGGVKRCDEQLADIEQQLERRVAWYRRGDLPTSTYVRLTPREHEAAALAAQGLANREIAEELHCSTRTVESHLAQARAKLGVSTRGELAELQLLGGTRASARRSGARSAASGQALG